MHLTITVHTNDELKKAITECIRNADRAILNTVFESTVRRVNKCLETGGGHFQHYLLTFCIVIIRCARMGEGRGEYRVVVGRPEGKRPLGRPRRRWEDNIKMDLQEMGRGCGDWRELAQDRDRWRALVSTVMNLRVQ